MLGEEGLGEERLVMGEGAKRGEGAKKERIG